MMEERHNQRKTLRMHQLILMEQDDMRQLITSKTNLPKVCMKYIEIFITWVVCPYDCYSYFES